MSDNKKNSCKTAIGCDAANCEYNEHGTGCSADHIRVDGRPQHRRDLLLNFQAEGLRKVLTQSLS